MTITTDLSGGRADPSVVDHTTNSADSAVVAGGGSADDLALRMATQRLGLRVQHPAVGVCVVAVAGELDLLTAPLLDACVREQLAAAPTNLILDLQAVRFLGASGLSCLLRAREGVQQTTGVRLHLAGLVTRAVARSLEVTGLREQFDTYPCLIDALTDAPEVTISAGQVGLLSVTGRLDDPGLTQLRRQLQVLVDTDTRYLVVNLTGVTSCDYRLFDVLAWGHQVFTDRQGWMRLAGVGPAVRNALDQATPSECLLVYQASDWTDDLAG
jgi:anti-sigma B factor antagonist